ncbi:MAG: hypothetical protein MUF78_03640 [Candidatus Edwardsbacteria bacterium]|jgi:hypothetical protein|nr:hypothetical protein [Candidatus Edwardsbacteria bacterium]
MGGERADGSRRLIALMLLAALLAAGCADPASPQRDNYLDPDGNYYQNPGIEFLAGPPEGATIAQDEVCYRWRGTGYASQFTHRLDARSWSEWSDADSARFGYLDDGGHQFLIYARTDLGVGGGPWRRGFEVNAAPSPGLITVPWRIWADSGSFFSITVIKKGAGPIRAARIAISYPAAFVLRQDVYIGSCWYPPLGTVHSADSSRPGVIDITYWLTPAGAVTAGDAVIHARFRAVRAVAVDSLGIGPASCLITASGDTVALSARRGGIISISQ